MWSASCLIPVSGTSLPVSLTKLNQLQQLLATLGPVAVAFSGGVDSSLLLAVSHQALHGNCLAVTVAAPFHFSQEISTASDLADTLGVRHHVLPFPADQLPVLLLNRTDRCYHCKTVIISACHSALPDSSWSLIDGSNHDDLKLYRPGRKALHEAGIRSPLAEVGITKREVRELARQLGLDCWNKPAQSCLLTRFPHDSQITQEGLQRIELLEEQLRNLGLGLVRARCDRDSVIIELDQKGLAETYQSGLAQKIINICLQAGFSSATISPSAYTLQ